MFLVFLIPGALAQGSQASGGLMFLMLLMFLMFLMFLNIYSN